MKRSALFTLALAALSLLPGPLRVALGASSSGVPVSRRQLSLAVQHLQSWYNPQTGLWNGAGWWNSANALTALIDASRATGGRQYDPVIERVYAANLHGVHAGFLNNYYDDEGWWALAWIDAYDLTGNPSYLGAASAIFTDMTGGWDNVCGGGLWWRKKRDYKNAIANELFLSVAAHLANRTQDPHRRSLYDDWAAREWNWFRHSEMIERDHLISDGLSSNCQDNHGRKWTYNQGVVLDGLAERSRQSHRRGDLRFAQRIAGAALHSLTDKAGVLHESCEPRCSGDGTQFKGIFVRNLSLLDRQDPKSRYRRFFLINADSILKNDQGPDHSFGQVWSGPPGKATASTQSSAIDALAAAFEP